MNRVRVVIPIFLFGIVGRLYAQPHGIETRAPNMALVIDELPSDDPGETQLVRVFPQLSFTNSIMLRPAVVNGA